MEKQEFDNLYSLLEKGQYDLVLQASEGNDDIDFLFCRLLSFYATGKFDEARTLIDKKFDILKERLSLLIKTNIESLLAANLFQEAEERMKFYSTLPYENQEVEEMLQSYPKEIKQKEKEYYEGLQKKPSSEIASILLTSKDESELISTMNEVDEENFLNCIDPLLALCVSTLSYSVRMFAFLTLVSKGYSKDITFLNKDNQSITVTLKDYEVLRGGEELRKLAYSLQSNISDSSLVNIALSLYPLYYLYYFPSSKNDESSNLGCALHIVARDYMQIEDQLTLENIVGIWNANPDKVLTLINKIKESSENF